MLLRHPAFRAHSQWRKEVRKGREKRSFDDAVGPVGAERARTWTASDRRNFSYLERGFYAPQIARLQANFRSEQLLVMRTEPLWSQTDATLDRVLGFLNVAKTQEVKSEQYLVSHDSSAHGTLNRDQQRMLTALFRDDILKTGKLIGTSLEDWLDEGYAEPMQGGDG